MQKYCKNDKNDKNNTEQTKDIEVQANHHKNLSNKKIKSEKIRFKNADDIYN